MVMATIEKRVQTPGSPPRYRVRWWASEKQRSKTFDRYEDARRFKAMLEGDLANGTYIDPRDSQITVAEIAARWFDSLVDIRPSTKDRVDLAMRHVLREFGTLPLSGVTHEHVTTWVTTSVRTLSPGSVRKNAFTLRRIMEFAVHQGLIKSNPATNVRLPPQNHKEQMFLDREEVGRLVESITPRYRLMVMLAVYGGFRFGELAALRRASVDPQRNSIRVSHTLVEVNGHQHLGPPKTKSSIRTVTIPRSVMAELVQHMDKFVREGEDSYLFTFSNGNPLRRGWFRNRVWIPALYQSGIDSLRFHDLRHTFVSLWVALGRNPKEVSKVAGHCSVAFTLDRYGHLYEQDDSGLADELDRFLGHDRPHMKGIEGAIATSRSVSGGYFRSPKAGVGSSNLPGGTTIEEED